MDLSFFSGNKRELSLLINIGNSSVSCSVTAFDIGGSSKPKVLKNARISFVSNNKPTAKALSRKIIGAVRESILAVWEPHSKGFFKKGSSAVSSVLVGVASPWYQNKIKDIHLEHDREFIISKNFISDVLSKEKISFEQEMSDNGKSATGKFAHKYICTECFPMSFKINGYVTKDSVGKKAQNFDLTVYMSAIEENLFNQLEDVIGQITHLDRNKISVKTFPAVFSGVAGMIFPEQKDFLFFDVTGELTDVTLVSEGIVSKMASFPLGRNFILRKIGEKFLVSVEIAESMLHMYLQKKMNKETSVQMEALMLGIGIKWSDMAKQVLEGFGALPASVYLTVESDMTDLITGFMKNIPGRENFFTVTFFGQNVLDCLSMSDATSPFDPYISLLVSYYQHFLLAEKKN